MLRILDTMHFNLDNDLKTSSTLSFPAQLQSWGQSTLQHVNSTAILQGAAPKFKGCVFCD
jgi:hypothetical protein